MVYVNQLRHQCPTIFLVVDGDGSNISGAVVFVARDSEEIISELVLQFFSSAEDEALLVVVVDVVAVVHNGNASFSSSSAYTPSLTTAAAAVAVAATVSQFCRCNDGRFGSDHSLSQLFLGGEPRCDFGVLQSEGFLAR
eukprot:CAMPEP_0168250300 /NCGR_PEP_ID=MMETSP0141_2-20121125/2476_1 /TAXON_ID=44445 /ORGANISM="Pseudo-nitzschia australis, Strain 10249 10 AB" /LENGTH=138 /DNA_ID=CAMNT_0008186381 /DNA_START=542 /DNA_END=955 /DNA_ORIENTATION=-